MTPMGAFPEHSSLLRLARSMLELLLLGDFALQRLHELEATVHDHHVLYLRLLPQCNKPCFLHPKVASTRPRMPGRKPVSASTIVEPDGG